ncbi:MAG: uncharacterized protein KVP18_003921 [Porospora cf. gigantea A]|uniref:uncharacterized protein n=1 Tax=Porospora cf. gigantea A TaxID=2853593 RepID=UPI00355AB7C5|nr:MAG: hypothetical protein KVP18_003921 [Porospora cf. gigantea A]
MSSHTSERPERTRPAQVTDLEGDSHAAVSQLLGLDRMPSYDEMSNLTPCSDLSESGAPMVAPRPPVFILDPGSDMKLSVSTQLPLGLDSRGPSDLLASSRIEPVMLESPDVHPLPVHHAPVEDHPLPVHHAPVEDHPLPVHHTPVEDHPLPVNHTPVEDHPLPVHHTPVEDHRLPLSPLETVPARETTAGFYPSVEDLSTEDILTGNFPLDYYEKRLQEFDWPPNRENMAYSRRQRRLHKKEKLLEVILDASPSPPHVNRIRANAAELEYRTPLTPTEAGSLAVEGRMPQYIIPVDYRGPLPVMPWSQEVYAHYNPVTDEHSYSFGRNAWWSEMAGPKMGPFDVPPQRQTGSETVM